MFFVFDKQKIYSYLIAASTVAILFILSFFFIDTDIKTRETSTNIENIVPTYNVQTDLVYQENHIIDQNEITKSE